MNHTQPIHDTPSLPRTITDSALAVISDMDTLLDIASRVGADLSVWECRSPGALDALTDWAFRHGLPVVTKYYSATAETHRDWQSVIVHPHGIGGCSLAVYTWGRA